MNLVEDLNKIAKKKFKFEIFDNDIAFIPPAAPQNYSIFVEFDKETNSYTIFDGGYVVTECMEKYPYNDDIFLKKFQSILYEFQINKNEDSLYLQCYDYDFMLNLEKFITAQQKILSIVL